MLLAQITNSIIEALRSRDLAKAESAMLKLPQAECSVIHHFGPGLYVREVHMPAGIFAVGHRQRFEHMNVFLKGRVILFKDDGSTEELVAPMMFVGKPGRKAGYVLEDVVWQNIYATSETDIEKLESAFLEKTDEFVRSQHRAPRDSDRSDYRAMLDEVGLSHELARSQSENESDLCPFTFGAWRVKTAPSAIEGTGLFATSPIGPGELIAPARVGGKRTPAGRYTNHSPTPNAEMVAMSNGDIKLVSLTSIGGCLGGQDGEEITIDYRQALSLSGIGQKEQACLP
jgi:hypothetical protein